MQFEIGLIQIEMGKIVTLDSQNNECSLHSF